MLMERILNVPVLLWAVCLYRHFVIAYHFDCKVITCQTIVWSAKIRRAALRQSVVVSNIGYIFMMRISSEFLFCV